MGVNPDDGMAALFDAIGELPEASRAAVLMAIEDAYMAGPPLAMVDSARASPTCTCPAT